MGNIFSSVDNNWTATSKHILITGASSGIGAELARNYAKQGAKLALLARSKDELHKVCKECIDLGSPMSEIFPVDLTDSVQLKSAASSAVDKFGKFDVVILNAGRSQGCYFEEINDIEQIDYMLKLNVNGIIHILHHFLHSSAIPMSSSSRIVVVGSVSGLIGVPYRSIYCASKFALTGFCNTLRIELLDTHGEDKAPKICLLNFPEVAGTKLNKGRMNFGAKRPPAEFNESGVANIRDACRDAMITIANGERESRIPLKLSLLLPLYRFIPNILDKIILKTVQKTHIRQDA